MGILVTVITAAFFVQWKCSLSMQWCSFLDELMPFTHFSRGCARFPLLLMLPLSFNSNYMCDGIIVFKIL